MSTPMSESPFQLFDPQAETLITERHLPHWAQSGALCFITWRTWDSLPRHVLDAWTATRNSWLIRQGIDPKAPDWKSQLNGLPAAVLNEFKNRISARWDASVDECHGACVLRRPELSKIVSDSLGHFDGSRYVMSDYVVMPNHVHVLAAFRDADQMLAQCKSWKHYTATQINRVLGRKGRFWEVDGFDHLVRSLEQFEYLREYIADNPRRAGLDPANCPHYSRAIAAE